MKSFTLAEIAKLTNAELVGASDHVITGVDDLESATSQEISFLDNPRYTQEMKSSSAGAIILHPSCERESGKNYLLHPTPLLAFQQVILAFLPKIHSGFSGIHPTAVIHADASLANDVTIGPHVTIDRKAIIGSGTILEAGVFVGAEVTIGQNCHLHPHVVVREGTLIGARVIIQPGAVIGSCGFGYFTDPKGKHQKLEHLGRVIIEDDVEIGANTTIDKARFKTTRIGRGSKIDNLVQIAHQVKLGEDNLIISQVGIAGSTTTGRNVVIGGQAGIVGHITLGDQVMLAARAGVSKSIPKGGIYSGGPAIPIREFNEQIVLLRNIKKIVARLKALEEKVSD